MCSLSPICAILSFVQEACSRFGVARHPSVVETDEGFVRKGLG